MMYACLMLMHIQIMCTDLFGHFNYIHNHNVYKYMYALSVLVDFYNIVSDLNESSLLNNNIQTMRVY